MTLQYSNFDLAAIVTPIDPEALLSLLQETNYDQQKTQFLYEGFKYGFRLGYQGPLDRRITSSNLRFRVGDKFDLWNKIMLEVKAKRYSGPYKSIEEIPFPGDGSATGWIQSPCGLVEKAGNKTRLINHHSFPPGQSLNDGIDDDHSKVTYQDLQDAVRISLEILKVNPQANIHYSKLDRKNAFRVLSIHPHDRRWQVLKAENPLTSEFVYFVDLCVSFGNRASCFLYEKFSRALAHVYASRAGQEGVSYLDDSLQIGDGESETNRYLGIFLDICSAINMPIAEDKSVPATPIIIFLGTRLNALRKTIEVPENKVLKALTQIDTFLSAKKVTVLQIQCLTGLLNFFCRAIVPGRAFTRRLYAAYAGNCLRQHYHVRVTNEMRLDLTMWKSFLRQHPSVLRPFVDFDSQKSFVDVYLSSDAAKSSLLGYAACCLNNASGQALYCFDRWEPDFQFMIRQSNFLS